MTTKDNSVPPQRRKCLRAFIVGFLLCFISAAVFNRNGANAQCALSQDEMENILSAATATLESDGYQVARFEVMFNSTCHPESVKCLGNNPSSPYGLYYIPSDIFLGKAFPYWDFDQSEALVFFGCTPPKGTRYFGFRSYVVINNFEFVFASMGDTNNQLTVNSTGTPGGPPSPSTNTWNPPEAAFDQGIAVITTADQNTDNGIRNAFASAGFSSSYINTDSIPFSLVKMGQISGDIFTFLYRVAGFENSTVADQYQNARWPVLRVLPPDARKAPFTPYPIPSLRPRGTGKTEAYLNDTFNSIVSAAKSYFGHISPLQEVGVLDALYIEGIQCIETGIDCLGDTRDAAYMDGTEPLLNNLLFVPTTHKKDSRNGFPSIKPPSGPQFLLTDNPEDFAIIIGVIHTMTAKATYTNVAVYDVDKEMGVAGLIDTALTGSSAFYLNSTEPNAEMIYVYKFARSCAKGEKYCYEIPAPPAFPSVPLDKPVTFVERAYLEPETAVGPDAAELLWPVVLHFYPSQ